MEGLFKPLESIILTYTVDSAANIKDYYYQNVGFEIVSEQFLGDALEIVCNFDKTLPSLCVTFVMDNGTEICSMLEGFQTDDYVMFGKDGGDRKLSMPSTIASTQTNYVVGNITWQDKNGNYHPCALMNIEIWDEEVLWDELLASSRTDIYGNFRVRYENQLAWTEKGCDVYVKLLSQGRTIKVKTGGESDVYEYESEVHDNYTDTKDPTINIAVGHDDIVDGDEYVGQAVQIAQAATNTAKKRVQS